MDGCSGALGRSCVMHRTFSITMEDKMSKPFKSVDEQISILKNRNLKFIDEKTSRIISRRLRVIFT